MWDFKPSGLPTHRHVSPTLDVGETDVAKWLDTSQKAIIIAISMLPLTEHDLEDFIIEHSPSIRIKIKQAEDDIKRGRVMSLDDYLSCSEEQN
jgi:hypothetical protein